MDFVVLEPPLILLPDRIDAGHFGGHFFAPD
jgi:hypothetical protein